MPPDVVQLRFRHAARPASIAAARHDVEDALGERMPRDRLRDVMLLVSELVTNAVRHADTDEFEIFLRISTVGIRIEVHDRGGGFVPRIAPREDGGGGYGLFIVDRLADRWGVERGEDGVIWVEVAADAINAA